MADTKQMSLCPIPETLQRTGLSFSNFTLNGTTDALEFIVLLREAGTITRLGIRVGTITGTTAAYKISLQSVSSGVPSGIVLGGGSPAEATFNPASLGWSANTWHWIDLDNSYPCSRNQEVAIVVEDSSGVDGSNNVSFTVGVAAPAAGHPYVIQNDAGSRTRQTTRWPIVGWGTSTTAYGWPLETITDQGYNTGSTPDEHAISLTPDASYGDTFKIDAVRFCGSLASSSSSFVVKLYDGTTVQQTFTGSTNCAANVAGTNGAHDYGFQDTSLVSLNFGSTYRVGINAGSANNVRVIILQCASADDWAAWPGGTSVGYSSRTDAGAWSDDNTKRLFATVRLADITEPSGGGGGGLVIGNPQFSPIGAF